MHQLFRAIGTVSCLLPWILLLSGARTAAADNVEPSKSSQQPSLQNVPQSRADMAPNAAPFHAAPNKNPLFLRSLINSASNKLVHGAFAGKRFDAPPGSPFLPPGGPLGSPGGPLGFPGSPLGSPGGLFRSPGGPFGSPGSPFGSSGGPFGSPGGPFGSPGGLGVPGQGLPPQAFAGGPLAGAGLQYFPQQRPLVPHPAQVAQPAGQKLTQKEFQQYMKAAAASKHVDTDNYLTKDQFQEYLKLATSDKKNKIKGAPSTLTPGEFEKLVLDAQHDLLKGKPNKGKLKTLTHDDFRKFFEKENGRPAGSAATPGKKHKRGHYSPSAGSFSSSGSASFSDEYSSPPKYLPAHPPKFESESEVYPEVFPAHQIETEDQLTKRSVLDALWRAFQAITGGALTIGGHLARGGGALLEAKGKLIASAGPVVSDFGRTVAAKAVAPGYSSVHSHVTPYHNYRDYVEESHAPQSSLLQTAYDVASSLKVAALGTTKAVADLISELSSASAKAYLLKD